VKKIRVFLESFRVRVALVLIMAMFFMALASNLIVQQFAIHAQFAQLRDQLKAVASAVALTIDPDMVTAVPLNRDGVRDPAYLSLYEKLEDIKQNNPCVGYIYILKKTDQKNILRFIVDPDPYLSKKGSTTAYPGDLYDASRFPNMIKAFDKALAEDEIQTDEWGTMLSGYAPIRDKQGKSVAIVGVDMMASDIYRTRKAIHERVLIVFLFGVGLSLMLGMWFSKKITESIALLAEGIRRVSQGDLEYKIEVLGHDEIAELSKDFNQMAEDLRESHRKNREYFYGIIRTLVLIVEARDPCTRGHSERVAEYACKIAKRMGFTPDKMEMLHQTALLHDIGKLGIHEQILRKSEKLTPEEWEILRSHPVIGEDILKPVFLNPEMLAVVRGHHERYDGQGYPDKLAGEDINIFAQILSVADAYDAMTSTRPYRDALSRQQAFDELKKNRGLQFNPAITDTFMDILGKP